MEKINLQVEKREILGSGVKKLREQGYIPAVVYGHNFDSVPLQIEKKNFEKAYKEAGESTLVYIRIGDQEYPTIIQEVEVDPVDDKVIHADFYKVSLTEKITTKVPLVFIGESLAVKDLGGILVKNINEIEVEAFPQDLPHNIEVDISRLAKFEDHVLISDLVVSDKVKIKEKEEEIVALVQQPISEEELAKQLEAPTVAAEEVEVIKKEKPEEEVLAEEAPPAAKEPEKKE